MGSNTRTQLPEVVIGAKNGDHKSCLKVERRLSRSHWQGWRP
jgi:hypothetical protein